MTLIVLLILAAVSLSAVFSDKGIFSRAEESGAKYNEAKAREVLETVLLADGQYEKNINPEYDQDDFLDELIKSEIPGSRIEGDVAIIGEWAFELDRSVPKIGRGLGKADKLVFPTVNATVELASDKKNATINITAIEDKNGINKIEIWLLGEKIEEYTYDNVKTEITVNPPYTATQNGKYTIKAYGDLMESKTVEVTGIVASVKFEPNGNEEWKKSHSTVATIEETADKVEKAKYVWTNSVTAPEDNQFPYTQTFNSGDTITGGSDNMTGTYYLWTMLETKSGEKLKWRSEGFNFDNEGPIITGFTADKYSIDGITLSATAQDTGTGIVKFEFYIDGILKSAYTQTITATTSRVTKTVNITGLTTGNHTCMVKVSDVENNSNTSSKSGTTKLYAWTKWNSIQQKVPKMISKGIKVGTNSTVFSEGEDHVVWCYATATPIVDSEGNPKIRLSTVRKYNDETEQSKIVGLFMENNHFWYKSIYNTETPVVNTVYKFISAKSTWTYGEGRHRWLPTNEVFEAGWDSDAPWTKGSTSYGTITSTSATTYKSEQRNTDGYWYIYKGIE